MPLTRLQKTALGLAGVTALVIGVSISLLPHLFYASYGVTLGDDPNLLSELRAPGAGLALMGGLMVSGLFHPPLAAAGFGAAFAVYLGFPLGRIVGIALDGLPSGGILSALAVEVLIAALLLVSVLRARVPLH